ncbi:taurine ABC transporter substrate-binding protein [Aquirhabdus sp.]|uniref:taurine ABC transporter substrate-binding protein n=1 Tax=Aquirhabdus sp. TaxID=2824160 RepID=UPI00396CEFF9
MKCSKFYFLPLLGLVLASSGCSQSEKLHTVVAYQTGVDPSKVAQAEGLYDKEIGSPVEWKRFNSGAEVINALASGDVDIGNLGSSPLAAGASRQLAIEAFIVSAEIRGAEAFVVRTGSEINSPADLIGKKIATPFVSTSHYSLLGALQHWQIPTSKITLINLNPSEINAAWQRGDIDGAFVWSPALAEIKKTGHVLTSADEVGSWGHPTFEVWVVRKDFAKAHPEIVSKFAKVTLESFANYKQHKSEWTAQSAPVAAIAKLTGVKPEDIPTLLEGASYPDLQSQLSPRLLAKGTAQDIAKTADFLKSQGMVNEVLSDYSSYVSTQFIQSIIAQK